jgi:hypothetical protein
MSTQLTYREDARADSNNPDNTNKNWCALEVATALGVEEETRYLHNWNDLLRAVRSRWIARSRKSSVKGKTVGAIRSQLAKLGAHAFVVLVEGHVLLLNCDGKTIVDTSPRKQDRRKIRALYGVFAPRGTIGWRGRV